MENSELTLHESNICWDEGILIRYNKKGQKIADFKAKEIVSISRSYKISFGAIHFGIGCVAGIMYAFTEVQSETTKWGLIALFAFLTFVSYCSIIQNLLVVDTKAQSFKLEVEDPLNDLLAFVHSVQEKLKEEKYNPRY